MWSFVVCICKKNNKKKKTLINSAAGFIEEAVTKKVIIVCTYDVFTADWLEEQGARQKTLIFRELNMKWVGLSILSPFLCE